MNYLCNGISNGMLRDPNMKQINKLLTESEFLDLLKTGEFKSVIGHQQMADYLSLISGEHIHRNRRGITINYDDTVLLVNLTGRLPENPKIVDYDGKINYSFVRFERQTNEDIETTLNKINAIKMEE